MSTGIWTSHFRINKCRLSGSIYENGSKDSDYEGQVTHPCHAIEKLVAVFYCNLEARPFADPEVMVPTISENIIIVINKMLGEMDSGQNYPDHQQDRKEIKCVTGSTLYLGQGWNLAGRPILCGLEELRKPTTFVPKTGPVK